MSDTFYSGHQIKALTGLRGVGALLVVFYHYHKAQAGMFEPIFDYGGTVGVMMFFSLSGYLLSYIYHTNFRAQMFASDYRSFMWKRIARIYPLHVFLLVLILFFYPRLNIMGDNGARQLFTNLTLTHGWTFDDLSYIGASWSISIEFLFYLVFPLLMLAVNRSVAVAVFLLVGGFYALVNSHLVAFPPELMPYLNHRIFGYGAFFVLGVCVFFMTQYKPVRHVLDNNAAFLLLAAVLVPLAFTAQLKFAVCAFTIPLLVRSAHTSRVGNYLLGGAVILLLGELSYSIYMSHQLIQLLVIRTAQYQMINPFYVWASTYILLFVWCVFCYHYVEVPMRSKLRSMFSHNSGS